MVGRRALDAKIGVRIPAGQPSFAKATEWHAEVLYIYSIEFKISHFLFWLYK
jgi:hypothetical protein